MKQRRHKTAARSAVHTLAGLAVVLAGCAIKSPPPPEDIRREAIGELETQKPWRAGDGSSAAVQDNWLATFGDAQLVYVPVVAPGPSSLHSNVEPASVDVNR